MTEQQTGAPVQVAIDGPAGSGKSSVSKAVARRLAAGYLDTGAVYRALSWWVLERGADTEDAAEVIAAFETFEPELSTDPDAFWIRVGGHDVTGAIREQRVSAAVSGVARVARVREGVNELFRRIVRDTGRIVVEGRDITTVVLPDAPVRILLTASPEVRAARRAGELGVSSGQTASVAEALHRRDAADSKVVEFLTAAPGVSVVDSTELDFAGTVAAVLAVIESKGAV